MLYRVDSISILSEGSLDDAIRMIFVWNALSTLCKIIVGKLYLYPFTKGGTRFYTKCNTNDGTTKDDALYIACYLR